jgi:hypothetical protein
MPRLAAITDASSRFGSLPFGTRRVFFAMVTLEIVFVARLARNIANATIKGFEVQMQARLGGFGFDFGDSS